MNTSNTFEMIEVLFPKTRKEDIISICSIIGNDCKNFGLDSNLRVAHFLAQVREEIGGTFKPISENLNYRESSLIKTFKYFRNNPDLAAKYGRNENHKANPEMIANIAYAERIGNGDIDSGDGWRFRGAGSLQITGKSNYVNVQKRINKYLPGTEINILDNNDIHTLKGCILAGAGFWIYKDIYRAADGGKSNSDVDSVTAAINKYTHSYESRRNHFNKISHLI